VIQERNEHNLMRDFSDEVDLYLKGGALAASLKDWCAHSAIFTMRIHELTAHMAAQNFWGSQEVELVDAWIEDLIDAGYQFPEIIQ